ncbi:hypothetical protein RQM65_01680 [Pricia sp. S334]|uniref:Uncharacterized protein n=1 Tax=Pricia mediterranea TaxID=3076079 RepID=A0ABU3L1C2_9FLAO|nr:hypothetical protein [Pricia sp. S334]MDT7827373.1 hypothetical protein [Pricia sp. S334]
MENKATIITAKDKFTEQIPVGPYYKAEDVSDRITFTFPDESSHAHGNGMVLDHGFTDRQFVLG